MAATVFIVLFYGAYIGYLVYELRHSWKLDDDDERFGE